MRVVAEGDLDLILTAFRGRDNAVKVVHQNIAVIRVLLGAIVDSENLEEREGDGRVDPPAFHALPLLGDVEFQPYAALEVVDKLGAALLDL